NATVALMPGAAETVTVPVPLRVPTDARTVAVPVPAGARYSPVVLTDPTPLTRVQVKAGCFARALPNWSRALAVSCLVALGAAVAGLTATRVRVCLTVRLTVLVAVRPSASRIVTTKV